MASSPVRNAKEHHWTTRERPWLVQWNRKLRHLQRIALRNLALSQGPGRRRVTTIDDEALPNSLKSPAKLLALREARTLEHSRSSSDLRPIHESAVDIDGPYLNGSPKAGSSLAKARPSMPRLRRRSTLEWTTSNPEQRQKKLEDVYTARMADIFFTLHVNGVDHAIYVSEVVEKTMNPDFGQIDLDNCGPGIARCEAISVKFWVRRKCAERFNLLLHMSLNFRSLQFIGRDLAAFSHPLPPNCVIFELTDGLYTCFTDAQVDEPDDPFVTPPAKASPVRSLPTASFDALLRLSKLDDSIQDALTVRDQLTGDLDRIVEESRGLIQDRTRVNETEDFVKTVDYAKATVAKQLRNLQNLRDRKRSELQSRQERMNQGRKEQSRGLHDVSSGQSSLEEIQLRRGEIGVNISQQRRRICEDLQQIYSIKPLPDRPLAFAIRGLYLPNSEDLEATPPETLAAALGQVTHVVQLLSLYLGQPLPYSINSRCSTSTISDTISIIKSGTSHSTIPAALTTSADPSRIFPLFPRGVPKFRFEYGLFLLNKDIELLLSNAFRVRVLDIRQTLPNLLYALYCATAGEGELPARKAGGVRGLLRVGKGGGASMPTTSRNASQDRSGGTWSASSVGKDSERDHKPNGGAFASLTKNQEDQERKVKGQR